MVKKKVSNKVESLSEIKQSQPIDWDCREGANLLMVCCYWIQAIHQSSFSESLFVA
jgi:hypothetical protein